MKNVNERELINRYLLAYNAFDVDGMVAVLSSKIRFENYTGEQLTAATNGIEEFRQLAEQSKTFFAEREQRIISLQDSDDGLIADIAYRGRLSRDIPDGPCAGTVLDLSGKSEFSFDGGLIVKIIDRS